MPPRNPAPGRNFNSVANDAIPITPSDADDIEGGPLAGIYVGSTGDVCVNALGVGEKIIFKSVPTGAIIPWAVTKVWSTGTTAAFLIGGR